MSTKPRNGPNQALARSRVSQRLAAPGSDVWRVHYAALARAERGEDVILMSVGDPDFDTPPYISDEVISRINAGRTHYSPAAGESELRQTIASMETGNTGNHFDLNQVAIFPGATAALYAACASICNEGDSILIPEPMYVGYHSIIAALGLDLVTVPLPAPDFNLDVDQLLARLDEQPATQSIKAVLVNTPGNPLGNMFSEGQLQQLAKGCAQRGVWLICDEVYSLITFETKHRSLLNCTNDYHNILVIDGLSKSHAMSGWRVGWAIGDEQLIQSMVRYSAAAFFGVSQFIQDAASYALQHDARDVEQMRKAYQSRRDHVLRRLNSMGLASYAPQAGMFVMLDASSVQTLGFKHWLDDNQTSDASLGEHFADWLLANAGISSIPGGAFGPSAANYVRLSLTLDEAGLDAALARIATHCTAPAA